MPATLEPPAARCCSPIFCATKDMKYDTHNNIGPWRRQSALRAEHHAKARIVCASRLSTRQVLLPLALVGSIFAVMGFIGGMLAVLNHHFQYALQLSKTESAGLQASFYGAYIIGPLTASGWLFRKYGYRKTITVGYTILALGCALFWPSGHFASFGGFCGSTFLVGSGIALLDCAAIPFMCNLGPARHSEVRVNIALAVQSSFSVGALMLSSYIILGSDHQKSHRSTSEALAPVQWFYLGAACFAIVMAGVCFFGPIPEIDDSVLGEQMELTSAQSGWMDKPLHKQLTLWWAFVALFCYTGAQGAIAAYFINYVQEIMPSFSAPAAARQLAIAQAVFAACRFGISILLRWVKPRRVLAASIALTIASLAAAMKTKGTAGLVMITIEFASKSCVFATIFSLALRGLGRHTKRGSAILVSAVSSGAVFAPATGAVADSLNTRTAFCVPLAGVVVAFSFPIYLNIFRARQLDAMRASSLALQPPQTRHDLRDDSTGTNTAATSAEYCRKDGAEKEKEFQNA